MVTKMKAKELGILDKQSKPRGYLKKQMTSIEYMRDHYEDLIKKYPNHWVMVRNGRVIGVERNSDRFVDRLSKARTSNSFLYYLASPRKRMLL